MTFYLKKINSPLGTIIAIADDNYLYLLEFEDKLNLEKEIEKIAKNNLLEKDNPILTSIEDELKKYFNGTLTKFNTPINLIGTNFQKKVWLKLQNIPHGKTISYQDLAISIGNQKAYRAVAKANSANILSIIVPCHRVINKNGNLSGYANGIERKRWLIEHENK